MINKDLGLFAYDSTNRETISAKRIENKHLLICKYLPSSLSSIISDIFTRISCLFKLSFVRFYSIYRGNTY